MAELPEWQVHDAAVYHTYEVEAADHLSLGVSLYIPLHPNHRNMGEFRIAILGGDDEEVCVPAIDVYHTLPQEVAGAMLHFAFASVKTLLPGNSTSCPWQDATTLIRKFAYISIQSLRYQAVSNRANYRTFYRTDPDPGSVPDPDPLPNLSIRFTVGFLNMYRIRHLPFPLNEARSSDPDPGSAPDQDPVSILLYDSPQKLIGTHTDRIRIRILTQIRIPVLSKSYGYSIQIGSG